MTSISPHGIITIHMLGAALNKHLRGYLMRAYFLGMASLSIYMLTSCYHVTLPCTTVSLSKDGCLIHIWPINLCPEIFGLRTECQDNPSLRSWAGIRVAECLSVIQGSIGSEWLVNILDNISNCRVQSWALADNHLYSHVDNISREGQSANQ